MLTTPSRKCVELVSLRGHLCEFRPLLSGELLGLAWFVPGGEEFPDLRPADFFHMLISSPPPPSPILPPFIVTEDPTLIIFLSPPPLGPAVAVTEDPMLSSL